MKIKRRKVNKGVKKMGRSGNPTGKRTSKNKEDLTLRQQKAVELRLEGKSFYKIAEACGVSVGQSYKDVKDAFKKVDKELIEKAEHLRTLELTRLDRLLEKLEESFKEKEQTIIVGKGKDRKAIKITKRDIDIASFIYAYVRIMDRRSKYITGLDAAQKFEADIGDNIKEQMELAGRSTLDILKRLAGEEQ